MRKSGIAAIFAVSFALVSIGARAQLPDVPSAPATEKACYDWGRAYQSQFDLIISRAKASDQRCQTTYKGKYEAIQGLCPNTTGGPVTYQNPCDEATKWTQCEWIGFLRGMQACLNSLSTAQKRSKESAVSPQPDYTLDEDDVVFLKQLAKNDEFIGKLAANSEGAKLLGQILEYVATGPMKVVVDWNLGLIREWRQANTNLEQFNKFGTCQAIGIQLTQTKALQYFDDLYRARGCDQPQ
jgi:hypothetical protein